MRALIFLCVALCLSAVDGNPVPAGGESESELVTVYVKGDGGSASELPDNIEMSFTTGAGTAVTLNLVKNDKVDINARMTFENIQNVVRDADENAAMYKDSANGASISVTIKQQNSRPVKVFKGTLNIGDQEYSIEPTDLESEDGDGASSGGVVHRLSIHTEEDDEDAQEGEPVVNVELPKLKIPDDLGEMPRQKKRQSIARSFMSQVNQKQKKATGKTIESYHVEVLIVLDHTIWERFMKGANDNEKKAMSDIKYYYSHIVNGMDLAYESIDADKWGFKISVWLSGFHIAKTPQESYWVQGDSITAQGDTYETTAVDGNTVLAKLGELHVTDGRTWSKPDHIMAMTRYDIFGDPTVGYAYVAGICMARWGQSIIEDHGFHTWSTAAHELGHNLGSYHDDSKDCPAPAGFIMTAKQGALAAEKASNAFEFSDCSIQAMIDTLRGLINYNYPRTCLTNRVCEHDVPLEGLDVLPGEKYSLDDQCELILGEGSTSCNKANAQEEVCYKLKCRNPSDRLCYFGAFRAAGGSPCGDGKWCREGQCVSIKDNPAVVPDGAAAGCEETGLALPTDECQYSDYEEGIDFGGGQILTCQDIARLLPHLCFDDGLKPYCCNTCHRAGLGTPTQHIVNVREAGNATVTEAPPSDEKREESVPPLETEEPVIDARREETPPPLEPVEETIDA